MNRPFYPCSLEGARTHTNNNQITDLSLALTSVVFFRWQQQMWFVTSDLSSTKPEDTEVEASSTWSLRAVTLRAKRVEEVLECSPDLCLHAHTSLLLWTVIVPLSKKKSIPQQSHRNTTHRTHILTHPHTQTNHSYECVSALCAPRRFSVKSGGSTFWRHGCSATYSKSVIT